MFKFANQEKIITVQTKSTGNTYRSRHTAKFLAHLIVLTMLFVLPEVVMAIAMPHRGGRTIFPGFYLKTGIFIAIFYLNYYLVIGKTLGHDKGVRIWRFLGYNLLLLVCGILIDYLFNKMFGFHRPRGWKHLSEMQVMMKYASFYLRDLVMMILTIALAVALRLSDRWLFIERRHQEVMAVQRETELEKLKSQLNPHFLFNTLNSIYALIEISPADARAAVHELSHLLRYMLYENPESVTLSQELDFVRNYVALMRLRLGNKTVKVDLSAGDYADAKIPPLIFVTLIENAFKYGNTGNPDDPIEVSIHASDGRIECRTFNHYVHDGQTGRSGGIGISNLGRRLQLIYGDVARLTSTVSDGTYTSTLTIPVQ